MTSTYLQNVREISEEGECTSPPLIAFGIGGELTFFNDCFQAQIKVNAGVPYRAYTVFNSAIVNDDNSHYQ